MTNIKKIILIILLLCLAIILTGCSLSPAYKSKSDIKKIVENNLGKDYKLIDEKSYEDDTDEHNKMYEYVFENSKGFSFSVFSYTIHSRFDASESAFYDAMVSNNYSERKIETNKDKITSILSSKGFTYDVSVDNALVIDIYQFTDVEKLSSALYEIEDLLDFEENLDSDSYSADHIYNRLNVAVYLHSGAEKAYSDVDLKYGITENEIKNELKNELIDYVQRAGDSDKYNLPKDELDNAKVSKAIYEYNKFEHVIFYYDKDIDDYYTSDLSICLNYDLYDYNHCDNLENIVKNKGGTFSRSGWTNTWTIGSDTWKATMTVDSKNNFKGLEVTKNGKKIDLKYSKQGENTIFSQYFTKDTVEKLLGCSVIINNNGGTVEIK